VHITCHGGLRQEKSPKPGALPATQPRPGAPFWTLNLSTAGVPWRQIVPDSLSQLNLTSKPLVFGNACQSAGITGVNASPGNLSSGFGPTFFSRGAIAFIGTVAPIHRTVALDFALRFYDNLLQVNPRLSVAKALWATKMYFYNRGTADPTYLFYCLYGPPDTEFVLV
jgi:CHAT domain-containing protein